MPAKWWSRCWWQINRTRMPLADTFVKRQALCQFCKKTRVPASFTLALQEMPDSGVLIGGKTEYAAVCRRHYLAHTTAP